MIWLGRQSLPKALRLRMIQLNFIKTGKRLGSHRGIKLARNSNLPLTPLPSFSLPQCVSEHWSEKIAAQNKEGCNVAGKLHVNKVVGNFHLSPGRAFQKNSMHVHDLVPYLSGTGADHHVS